MLFYGVVTPTIERIAAQNPPEPHADPPDYAVLLDSLPRILRAAWREAAGGRPETRGLLIQTYQADSHSLHDSLQNPGFPEQLVDGRLDRLKVRRRKLFPRNDYVIELRLQLLASRPTD